MWQQRNAPQQRWTIRSRSIFGKENENSQILNFAFCLVTLKLWPFCWTIQFPCMNFRRFYSLLKFSRVFPYVEIRNPNAGLQICPLHIFASNPPQMVPTDLNIGFQGLALIQCQMYNPESEGIKNDVPVFIESQSPFKRLQQVFFPS